MTIPIILPVYNQFPYIKIAVEWLFNKGYRKPEYVIAVINDGSTNPVLLNWLEEVSRNDHIEIHNYKDNKGCLTAFNRGIQAYPNAEIYLIGNDDTYPMLDCIEQMVWLIRNDGRIGLVSPLVNPPSHKIQELYVESHIEEAAIRFDFETVEKHIQSVIPKDVIKWSFANAPETSFYALSGDMVRRCGIWNDTELNTNGWYSNIDYMVRMREKGYHGVILQTAFIYHFHATTNDWRKLQDQNQYNLSMVNKWFGSDWMGREFQPIMPDDPLIDIAEYYQLWAFEYPRLVSQADRQFQGEWNKLQPQDELKRTEWYGNSDAYLYKLVEWHRTDERRAHEDEIIEALKNIEGRRILDFGGGIGQTVINLARSGNSICYRDVPGRCQEFAKWRSQKKKLNIGFDNSNLLSGVYSAIICIDVLEHIESPFKLVKSFHDIHLEGNGLLVLEVNFTKGMGIGDTEGYGEHLKENMQYQSNWKELVKQIGFKQIDNKCYCGINPCPLTVWKRV